MYETLIHRLEADAEEYDVSLATVAEWAVDRAVRGERRARTNVTRAATSLAKARRRRDWLLSDDSPKLSPYDEGRAIGKVEAMEDKLGRKIEALAYEAHALEDARAALAEVVS